MAKRGKLHGEAKREFLERMASGRRKRGENPAAEKSYIGERVELPVHYDLWMRGAKYGVVTGFRRGKAGQSDYLLVKMDNPNVRRRVKLWRIDWPYAKFLGRETNPGRRAVHTAKFDRCVTDVKKSLRKYRRKGNAYAICGADLPHGGVKKSHRRRQRQKNMKPIHGAVIVVHLRGKRPYYYGTQHFLTSNRTAARVYHSIEHAKKHALQIANELETTGTHARITLNRP